ncbi:hypothetical protein ACLSY8_06460 [Avibacterium avium]|uniref:hypothetical protein n=1 Tax=Avibacterium avium TaxID=751 RepID=UPI003BF7D938
MREEISLKKIILFWTAVVLFNAALCFAFGLMVSSNVLSVLGMIVGIGFFIAFYSFIDYKLWAMHKHLWRNALRQSGIIRGCFQISILLHFSIEFFCGFFALSLLEVLFGGNISLFLHSLLATLLTGTFLSVMLGIICLICFWIAKSAHKVKE